MKKKLLSMLLFGTLFAALAACGGGGSGETAAPSEPLDLTGEWKQTNNESEDSWQAATITADTIEVYWVSDGGDTKALYWAGTYAAPTSAEEPYSWDSVNDTEKTSSSLLASGDETKTFTYEGGELSFDASALGVTTTIRMEKQ